MVQWSDPNVIAYQGDIFKYTLLVLLGLYGWECLGWLSFDYRLLLNLRQIEWPTSMYLVCRYATLFSLIGLVVTTLTPTYIPCQSLYTMNQFWGNCAIGAASSLLLYRAIAMSSRPGRHEKNIQAGLAALSLGQWVILFYSVVTVRSAWSSEAGHCIVVSTDRTLLSTIFLYTMGIDFVALAFSLFLLRWYADSNVSKNKLWRLLLRQGLVYFLVAFTCNSITVTFIFLRLNPVMEIMFTVPACVVCTIVACRSFISLREYKAKKQRKLHFQVSTTTTTHTTPRDGSRVFTISRGQPTPTTTTFLSRNGDNVALTLPPSLFNQTADTSIGEETEKVLVLRGRYAQPEEGDDIENQLATTLEHYSTIVFALPEAADSTVALGSPRNSDCQDWVEMEVNGKPRRAVELVVEPPKTLPTALRDPPGSWAKQRP